MDIIGKKLQESTCEKKYKSFLLQRIGIANQKGNAVSIFGKISQDKIRRNLLRSLIDVIDV